MELYIIKIFINLLLIKHYDLADVHDKKTRSYNMSKISGKNTKPELLVRKSLFKRGFRYRVNVINLKGTPDIVLKKYNTIIFINGCFWHGHRKCKKFVVPKTRTEWWINKINANIHRDKMDIKFLRQQGWKVFTLWECELQKSRYEKTISNLIKKIIQ